MSPGQIYNRPAKSTQAWVNGGSSNVRMLGRSGVLCEEYESPSSLRQVTHFFNTCLACLSPLQDPEHLTLCCVLLTVLCFTSVCLWWISNSMYQWLKGSRIGFLFVSSKVELLIRLRHVSTLFSLKYRANYSTRRVLVVFPLAGNWFSWEMTSLGLSKSNMFFDFVDFMGT